jgi:2-oxo-3-(phosphooxy)propyl 3-oxoalkanoate synthase
MLLVESEREVVLATADEPGRWQLRVLTSSPWLFDHPVDHIPGMLLMEAARQCGNLSAYGSPTQLVRMDAEFERYLDLDAPSWVEFTPGPLPGLPDGEREVRVNVTQHGLRAFTASSLSRARPGSTRRTVRAAPVGRRVEAGCLCAASGCSVLG